MAGRGRGATLPAWMTQTHAPGAPEPLVAGLPAASSPPADTGQSLYVNSHHVSIFAVSVTPVHAQVLPTHPM